MAKKKLTQNELLEILTNRTSGYDLDEIARQAGFDDFFDFTEDETLEEFHPTELQTTKPHGGKRDGAGRKPSPNKKVKISPSVTLEFKMFLADLAKERGISQGELIEKAIQEYVKKTTTT